MAAPSSAADQLDALRPLAEKGKANVAARKKLFATTNSDGDRYLSLEEATGVVKSTWPALANVHCINFAYGAADHTGGGAIDFKELRLFFFYFANASDSRLAFEQIHLDKEQLLPAAVPISFVEFAEGAGAIRSSLGIEFSDSE